MTTQEMTTSDVELALELLNKHKEAQKQKQIDEDRYKKHRRELMIGIKQLYDILNVPHKDVLIITGFQLRRTIIGGYSVILNLTDKDNPVTQGDYEAGRDDNTRFAYQGITGRQRGYRIGQDSYNEETMRHENYWNNYHYQRKQIHHTFYENRIHQCPFCGHEEAQPDKHKWESGCPAQWFSRRWGLMGDLAEMKADRLYKTPVKYKRCEECKDMSHKQYLANYTPRYGKVDKPRKKIFDAMYPSPLEHDEDYFMDKRNRKLELKQDYVTAMNDDVDDCDVEYRYDHTGNVYLMSNNHTGRTKIGMTKNEPKFRESTLQSEDPDVELNFHRRVLVMRDTEKYLHDRFADKRYRGEWFDLSDEEVEEAKSLIEKATIEIL